MMGGVALCGALCYGELAARFPEAGGGYVYLREAYGKPVAFLYGWMALLVMDPGLTAALAVGLASYVGYIFNLSPVSLKVVAIGSIVFVAFVNIRGVKLGGWLIRWLTIFKLGLLGIVIIWGFASGAGNWSNFQPLVAQRPGSVPLLGALAGGIVGAFFAFGGWWDLSKLAGEVRDPERTLPRALVYGVTILTAVYILTSAAFMYLVPLEQVTSGETFAAQAGEVLFGQAWRAGLIRHRDPGGIGKSCCRCHVGASCVLCDGSRWTILFGRCSDSQALRHTGPRDHHSSDTRFAAGARGHVQHDHFLFCFCRHHLYRAHGDRAVSVAPQSAPKHRLSHAGLSRNAIIFLILIALLLLLLAGNKPLQSFLGVGVVALGLPVYYLLFRHRSL